MDAPSTPPRRNKPRVLVAVQVVCGRRRVSPVGHAARCFRSLFDCCLLLVVLLPCSVCPCSSCCCFYCCWWWWFFLCFLVLSSFLSFHDDAGACWIHGFNNNPVVRELYKHNLSWSKFKYVVPGPYTHARTHAVHRQRFVGWFVHSFVRSGVGISCPHAHLVETL